MSQTTYESDIVLGQKYHDPHTDVTGVAVSVHFYEFACERVALEFKTRDGKISSEVFDAPRLRAADTGNAPSVTKTGGPGDRHEGPRGITR